MTVDSGRVTDTSQADLLSFLECIEQANPELAADVLTREVDSLLGRKPALAKGLVRAPLPERKPQRRKSSAFDWYQPIVAKLPPVLDAERTAEAAAAVEVGLFAEERLNRFDPARTALSEVADLHTLIERGRSEYRLLILSNLRLVFHWSKGIAQSIGEDWVQDAFQAGCIGLMRGLQGWDYTIGYTLSTFVSWHVRQAIQRWRTNEVSIIRIPTHVWEKLESGAGDFTTEIEAAAVRAQNIVSIDDLGEDDAEAMSWDGGIYDAVLTAERRRIVDVLLRSLPEREAMVLQLRHGLSDFSDEPQTLDMIGRIFHLTRERIRQVEKSAIDSLREHPLAHGLDDLLLYHCVWVQSGRYTLALRASVYGTASSATVALRSALMVFGTEYA